MQGPSPDIGQLTMRLYADLPVRGHLFWLSETTMTAFMQTTHTLQGQPIALGCGCCSGWCTCKKAGLAIRHYATHPFLHSTRSSAHFSGTAAMTAIPVAQAV